VFHTLHHNDVSLLEQLYTNGLRLTDREASLVLDRVVSSRKNIGFVPLLVSKFGADVSFSKDGKRTLLIKAVESKSKDMVQVLVDEGANPYVSLDETVGSAMDLAEKYKLHAIEDILEKY
jgi:ankyrin repeat protein